MEILEGACAFAGAVAFIMALRTEIDYWFVLYTLLFASCVAIVVLI